MKTTSRAFALAFALLASASFAQQPASAPSPAATAATPVAPMGQFEASGARLGMDMDLALKVIATTKPQWGQALESSGAAEDCAHGGRAMANLEFSGGQVSARMFANCAPGPTGKPTLTGIRIITAVGSGLTAKDIHDALVSRYGMPLSESPADASGFSMMWASNPAMPDFKESLTAVLSTAPLDGHPTHLTLSLTGGAKPASASDTERARALSRLPF